jgi:ATP-dependent DNA ligase
MLRQKLSTRGPHYEGPRSCVTLPFAAVESLTVGSCFIDRQAIVVDSTVFDLLRYRQHDRAAVLCAFDLIELDGKDLRQQPIEEHKHALA